MKNRIQQIREARGLSQEALGEAVGADHTTIGRIEKRDLFKQRIRKICEILGVRPGDLLSDADNPHRIRNENEAALLDIFRRLTAENQTKVISRTQMLRRAQEGLITEAEMEPNLPPLPDFSSEPDTEPHTPRTKPPFSQGAE